jgi:hypothetical protein
MAIIDVASIASGLLRIKPWRRVRNLVPRMNAASRRRGPSRNWTRKGEDVLHPRLGRGRSLETDTTRLLWVGDYSESV